MNVAKLAVLILPTMSGEFFSKTHSQAKTHREANLVPRLFPLRASLEESGPGWSRVSQILGDNNWDLWGVGKTNVAFEFKTIQGV